MSFYKLTIHKLILPFYLFYKWGKLNSFYLFYFFPHISVLFIEKFIQTEPEHVLDSFCEEIYLKWWEGNLEDSGGDGKMLCLHGWTILSPLLWIRSINKQTTTRQHLKPKARNRNRVPQKGEPWRKAFEKEAEWKLKIK